jgi:hypothetical protein
MQMLLFAGALKSENSSPQICGYRRTPLERVLPAECDCGHKFSGKVTQFPAAEEPFVAVDA